MIHAKAATKKIAMEKQHLVIKTLIENFNPEALDINISEAVKFNDGRTFTNQPTAIQELLQNSLRVYGQVRHASGFEDDGQFFIFDGYGIIEAMKAVGQQKATILKYNIKKEDVAAVKFIIDWDKDTSYRVKADNLIWLKDYCRKYVLANKGETYTRTLLSILLKMSEKSVSMFETIVEHEDADGLIDAMDKGLETLNSAYKIATGKNVRGEANEPKGKTTRQLDTQSTKVGPYPFCHDCPKLKDALRTFHMRDIDLDMPLDGHDCPLDKEGGHDEQ